MGVEREKLITIPEDITNLESYIEYEHNSFLVTALAFIDNLKGVNLKTILEEKIELNTLEEELRLTIHKLKKLIAAKEGLLRGDRLWAEDYVMDVLGEVSAERDYALEVNDYKKARKCDEEIVFLNRIF